MPSIAGLGGVPKVSMDYNYAVKRPIDDVIDFAKSGTDFVAQLAEFSRANDADRDQKAFTALSYLSQKNNELAGNLVRMGIADSDPDAKEYVQLVNQFNTLQSNGYNEVLSRKKDWSDITKDPKLHELSNKIENLKFKLAGLSNQYDNQAANAQAQQQQASQQQKALNQQAAVARTMVPKSNTPMLQRIGNAQMGTAQPEDQRASMLNRVLVGGGVGPSRTRTPMELVSNASPEQLNPKTQTAKPTEREKIKTKRIAKADDAILKYGGNPDVVPEHQREDFAEYLKIKKDIINEYDESTLSQIEDNLKKRGIQDGTPKYIAELKKAKKNLFDSRKEAEALSKKQLEEEQVNINDPDYFIKLRSKIKGNSQKILKMIKS